MAPNNSVTQTLVKIDVFTSEGGATTILILMLPDYWLSVCVMPPEHSHLFNTSHTVLGIFADTLLKVLLRMCIYCN